MVDPSKPGDAGMGEALPSKTEVMVWGCPLAEAEQTRRFLSGGGLLTAEMVPPCDRIRLAPVVTIFGKSTGRVRMEPELIHRAIEHFEQEVVARDRANATPCLRCFQPTTEH